MSIFLSNAKELSFLLIVFYWKSNSGTMRRDIRGLFELDLVLLLLEDNKLYAKKHLPILGYNIV